MSLWELFLIAVGLSMDAFAVSICKGLSVGAVRPRHALTAGLWFGGFQALMPFLGWLLGSRFQGLITSVDHWIAFVLLCALAVGVTFAFLRVDILPAVCFIGAVTFVFSFAGVKMGSVFGARYQSKAELFGGGVLIGMGIKILLEHLGVLG